MGSSKKHKEKHHKKEKRRRRSRSRSRERKRSQERSRSRSPIERGYGTTERISTYRPGERQRDRHGHGFSITDESSYNRGGASSYSSNHSFEGTEAVSKRSQLVSELPEVRIKQEPGLSENVSLSHYAGTSKELEDEILERPVKSIKKEVRELSNREGSDYNSVQRDNDDRNRDRDYQDEVERRRRAKLREWKMERERLAAADQQSEGSGKTASDSGPVRGSSGGDNAISIEETNKLRAKLGLKPLNLNDGSGSGNKEELSYEDREDVHRPATNLAEQKHATKLKEKLDEIREKRKIQKRLEKVSALGASDADPTAESAAAWVAKSRKLEQEKAMAEKRAQMLAEMDEEFGISGIADKVFGVKEKQKQKAYTSRDLQGLKVEHTSSEFQGGSAVVLTLKDKGVLDEDEDVLENVNLVDRRKALKNVENKKKRPDYQPYDEADEDGMFRPRDILEKYNEEIDGERMKSFRLDRSGRADVNDELELQRIRENLQSQQVSLQMDAPQTARDYYTKDEMVKFNKPKKKRKIRKREMVKADDLMPLGDGLSSDHGSRTSKGILKSSRAARRGNEYQSSKNDDDMDISDEGEPDIPPVELPEDEAEIELQMALERSRKLKRKDQSMAVGAEKVAQVVLAASQVQNEEKQSTEKKPSKGTIILDSTSEFCRTLGEVPNTGPERPMKEESDDEDMMYAGKEYDVKAGGWSRVYETKARIKEEPQVEENVLDAEPVVSHGVASALQLATMKGFLEMEKKKEVKKGKLNLPETKAFIDEEKMRDEDRDRHHRYDSYGFKEKEGYKPDIKLEYVDESGRQLNQKEAFRYLSHKFHGKGSGKMKTEKRSKKQGEEARLEQMSAIDTPLGTVQMMAERQKQASTPYVVLSGGGKNLLSSERISKK